MEQQAPQLRVKDIVREKLTDAFSPILLNIIDESHLHKGHVGARPGGETHFRVEIVSERFRDLSRIERQRLVHDVLAEELKGPIHALSLSISTPPSQ